MLSFKANGMNLMSLELPQITFWDPFIVRSDLRTSSILGNRQPWYKLWAAAIEAILYRTERL